MWQIALFALASISAPKGVTIVEGVAFGPSMTITCTWFSNFENSRIEQCWNGKKKLIPLGEAASLKCLNGTCRQLDAEARKVSRLPETELPEGTFSLRLVGRIGLNRHEPRYIGDGTRTVLIEKLLSVQKSK